MTSASQTDFIATCAKQVFTRPYFIKRFSAFPCFPLGISAQLISDNPQTVPVCHFDALRPGHWLEQDVRHLLSNLLDYSRNCSIHWYVCSSWEVRDACLPQLGPQKLLAPIGIRVTYGTPAVNVDP